MTRCAPERNPDTGGSRPELPRGNTAQAVAVAKQAAQRRESSAASSPQSITSRCSLLPAQHIPGSLLSPRLVCLCPFQGETHSKGGARGVPGCHLHSPGRGGLLCLWAQGLGPAWLWLPSSSFPRAARLRLLRKLVPSSSASQVPFLTEQKSHHRTTFTCKTKMSFPPSQQKP